MKIVIKTLLLSCLALTNAVSFCMGWHNYDPLFHNHAPSLWYSATTKLGSKQIADLMQRPYAASAIIYADAVTSFDNELTLDEVMSAINHNLISLNLALEIAFDKKRLDIAESIVEHLPTQTQEQKDIRINAIKATQIAFSNINTANDIRIMLAELPYVEFPSHDSKANSGLSRYLVEEVQRTLLNDHARTTAEILVNSLAHNSLPDLRNQLPGIDWIILTTGKRSFSYDLYRALTGISLEQNNTISQETIEAVKDFIKIKSTAPFLEFKLRKVIDDEEETPATIKHVLFLLKSLPKNYPLEKRILESAARQNKKAFLSLLFEYDKETLFNRCVYTVKASIPRRLKNILLTIPKAMDKHRFLVRFPMDTALSILINETALHYSKVSLSNSSLSKTLAFVISSVALSSFLLNLAKKQINYFCE